MLKLSFHTSVLFRQGWLDAIDALLFLDKESDSEYSRKINTLID